MPTQQTPNNSTPAGTGQGGGLRGAASAIAGMLSDDFTIADTGHDDGGRAAPQQRTQQQQRSESRDGHQQTHHDDDEPIVRDDEEIDDEGNVRFREADDGQRHDDDGNLDGEGDENPEGQHEPKDGELKDDTKVTIALGDDKTEDVTLGELKKGYLRQADYTRKTQALTTERDTLTKDRTDIGAERASLTASIEAVGRFVKEIIPPEPTAAEWEILRQRDPNGYAAAREEWRSFKERLQGVEAAFRNAQQGQQAELQRTIRDTAEKEKAKLADALPEWKDARVKKRDIADIFEAAKKMGFSEDDVKNTVDHRLMLMCLKAAKYDRLMSAKKSLSKENRGRSSERGTPTKVMEPGARGQMPTRKTAVVNARDNHHKSQSLRSGAALIERLLD